MELLQIAPPEEHRAEQEPGQTTVYNDNRVQIVNLNPVRTVLQTTEDYNRLMGAYERLTEAYGKCTENGKRTAQLLSEWVSRAQSLEAENRELRRRIEDLQSNK